MKPYDGFGFHPGMGETLNNERRVGAVEKYCIIESSF